MDNEFFNFDAVVEIEKRLSYEQGRADREKEILDTLRKLVRSDYNSKECKLLISDLLEFIN